MADFECVDPESDFRLSLNVDFLCRVSLGYIWVKHPSLIEGGTSEKQGGGCTVTSSNEMLASKKLFTGDSDNEQLNCSRSGGACCNTCSS